MNMIKVGNVLLNLDRINCIEDHRAPGDPSTTHQPKITRVSFDHSTIDLVGGDANTLRRWYRHIARDINPHRDQDGEELISPEDQLRKAFDHFLHRMDLSRPRDHALRAAARQLYGMIDQFITGELEPMRIKQFEQEFAPASDDAGSIPGPASS
jgi:hypothetical protein